MPVKTVELDASVREEDVTLIIGKNIILKFVEDRRTEQLLLRPEVKVLLSTPDLCHTSFVEKMNSLLQLLDWQRLKEPIEDFLLSDFLLLKRRALKMIPKEILMRNKRLLKKASEKFFDIIERRDQEIVDLEGKMVNYNPNLTITRPTLLLSCPHCNIPIMLPHEPREGERSILGRPIIRTIIGAVELHLGEFKGCVNCFFCKNPITRAEVERHPTHEIIPSIEEAWRSGLWLEEYVASILRSLEWKTWTRVNILGTSGIPHEVNLLAIKKGFVLVGECKTGKVSREDVFTFSTKMTDLKSHLGLFGLLGELPEPETREFIEKNPAVTLIEKMCELKRKDLIERLRSAIGEI